jgi:inner membrane protein
MMTHAFTAVALGQTLTAAKLPPRFWALAVVSSLVPDADVIGFELGIQYGDLLGHRGFAHSLTFALAWSFGAMSLVDFQNTTRRSQTWWKLVALLFAITASHGVLDALTNGGLGVAFFAPFDGTRYFFPWRPLVVSPISFEMFFTDWGGAVLQSELKFIWLPLLALWLAVALARKVLRKAKIAEARM